MFCRLIRYFSLLSLFFSLNLCAKTYHEKLSNRCSLCSFYYIFSRTVQKPFDELFITWNAQRPEKGYYEIYASVKDKKWSPWLLYATWGAKGQRGYKTPKEGVARVYQDAVQMLEGKGRAFRIKIVAKEGATLEGVDSAHVACNESYFVPDKTLREDPLSVELPLAGLSQMALADARGPRLCSPTSTTAAIQYLTGNKINPIEFAEKVWDEGFDIFGNWVFNLANAYTHLDSSWSCWVERLSGFDALLDYLYEGSPVVISVKGPLKGSAQPYSSGHLLVVKGYDHTTQEVLCMDPAFAKDEMTHVRYKLDDLVEAWERRGFIAYLFKKNEQI